ncbi:hypothetical protein ACOSP7_021330 [Xanthoceras sorbifolium]
MEKGKSLRVASKTMRWKTACRGRRATTSSPARVPSLPRSSVADLPEAAASPSDSEDPMDTDLTDNRLFFTTSSGSRRSAHRSLLPLLRRPRPQIGLPRQRLRPPTYTPPPPESPFSIISPKISL